MIVLSRPKKSVDVDPRRAKALDKALVMSRLLEKDYFDDVVKAVDEGKKADFVDICKRAELPNDLVDVLWSYAQTGRETYIGVW